MTVRYLDTSLLVPLFIREPRTLDVQAWLAGLGSATLATSAWGVVEFSSAASIKTRTQEISPSQRTVAQAAFQRFLNRYVRVIVPAVEDLHRAAELCDRWQLKLRAGDALHVAIAERRGLAICTLDQRMADVANALGVSAETF